MATTPFLKKEAEDILAGDPLGIAFDFESSETLAELSYHRFLRDPSVSNLMGYQALLLEIAVQIILTNDDALEEREWFVREHKKLAEVREQGNW